MNHKLLASTALGAVLGLALVAQGTPSAAQQMKDMPQVVKDNMMKAEKEKLQKCYGINAAMKNDCAEGAHSCAGHASAARDPKSFVLLPAGVCAKIAGGKTSAT
jgi:uncharacterized membrane protein